MKFDVVIGNPPYNNIRGTKTNGNLLWDKFVIKSLNDITKIGGYLCFVHPSLWRKPQTNRTNTKNQFLNGKLHGEQLTYFENGQLRYKEQFLNGKKHGVFWKSYWTDVL